MTCLSLGDNQNALEERCNAGGKIVHLEMKKQISSFPCDTSSNNFGSFGSDVWVSNGCGAEFSVKIAGIIAIVNYYICQISILPFGKTFLI